MPTGYTNPILEGEINNIEDFAKLCARAFGALVHLRGEPLNAEYKPLEVSNHYNEAVELARQRIEEVNEMSNGDLIDQVKGLIETELEYHRDHLEKAKEHSDKLNALLKEAEEWTPPTDEHNNLKAFMIDQIQKTIDADCDTSYDEEEIEKLTNQLENLNADEIRANEISQNTRSIEYNEELYEDEVERVKKINQWYQDLAASFKKEEV